MVRRQKIILDEMVEVILKIQSKKNSFEKIKTFGKNNIFYEYTESVKVRQICHKLLSMHMMTEILHDFEEEKN